MTGLIPSMSCPTPDAGLDLGDGCRVTCADEVITFVNRNLEPYRGYHIFMRALPRLLKERPKARVLLVGGDEVSYGAQPPKGQSWKQIFIDEVRGKIATPDWSGSIPWAYSYERFLSLCRSQRACVSTYPLC